MVTNPVAGQSLMLGNPSPYAKIPVTGLAGEGNNHILLAKDQALTGATSPPLARRARKGTQAPNVFLSLHTTMYGVILGSRH